MAYRSKHIPQLNPYKSSQPDINILIMGETGVGKSTLINAFANYLVYNTLHDAIKGDMQVLIPATFHITDSDTFETKKISIGNQNDDEKGETAGESCTQVCRSYLFRIGNRLLRLIDAPGIGDVRGIEQDKINCDHILSYINQYDYLNGICLLFKPNNERLTINFRFCFKEILTHLHINAKDNLMFIFTNGRASFYRPGATTPLIRKLLDEINQTWHVVVPFDKDNTFIFDNEAFKFLASYKNGMRFSDDEIGNFDKSWKKSVEEFSRLIERILKCDRHAVRESYSINSAHQLLRLLRRPIGEIARLIQENIQLAEKHKQNILRNPSLTLPRRIPQKVGKMIEFEYPRTVCTNRKCTQVITVDDERQIDYINKCHPRCYLRDVELECVGHSILQYCDAINRRTGLCNECGCHWKAHMHISYEYRTSIIFVEVGSSNTNSPSSAIDQRIAVLRDEEAKILEVCNQLAKFIKQSSLTPYNEDILEYIRYFIREEETKRGAGADNKKIIEGLQKLIDDYEREQKLFDESFNINERLPINHEPFDIFGLVTQLYKKLPIHGPSIRDQVERLKAKQLKGMDKKEHHVQIPSNATNSNVMQSLQKIVN